MVGHLVLQQMLGLLTKSLEVERLEKMSPRVLLSH
jgi:hypothetical protein